MNIPIPDGKLMAIESSAETGLACDLPFSGLDSTWSLGHPASNCGQAEPVFGEYLGYWGGLLLF